MWQDKLQIIEDTFMDLEQQISDPAVIARQDEWRQFMKRHADLADTVNVYREYKKYWPQLRKQMKFCRMPRQMKI